MSDKKMQKKYKRLKQQGLDDVLEDVPEDVVIPEKKIELTREQQIDQALLMGISKKKMGLCKNEKCYNASRVGSSYCQECSDKFNKK